MKCVFLRKFLSVLLTLVMVICLIPMTALTVSAATTVSVVKATVPTPVVNEIISATKYTYTPTAGVEITDLNWTRSNGSIYPEGTKFQSGVTYYCDIEFTVKDGYTFPSNYKQLTGYINDIKGEISTVYYTDHAYVTVAFTPVQKGEIYVGGVGMTDGDYLQKDKTSTTKSKPSDNYAFYSNGTLTLHNYEYTGIGFVGLTSMCNYSGIIYTEQPLQIVLEGNNKLNANGSSNYTCAIYNLSDENSENGIVGKAGSTLKISSDYRAISVYSNLNIKDCYITVESDYYGIYSYGNLMIDNSYLQAKSYYTSVASENILTVNNSILNLVSDNSYTLFAYNDIHITNMTATTKANYDSVCARVKENKFNSADIIIKDCNWTMSGGYGIYSDENTTVSNSFLDINAESYAIYANDTATLNTCRVTVATEDSGICCAYANIKSSQLDFEAYDSGLEAWEGKIDIQKSNLQIKADYGLYADKCDMHLTDCSISIIGDSAGILTHKGNLNISNCEIETTANNDALNASEGVITFTDNLGIQASNEVGGTVEIFDSAKAKEYKWVKVHKHIADNGTVTKKATCTATGNKIYKCTVCAKILNTETVDKVEHNYKKTVTKATSTKDGVIKNVCTKCGYTASKTTPVYKVSSVKLSNTSYIYNGQIKTPSVTVKNSKGNALKKDTDYTVKYESGRKMPGKYTVTVTFKGNYSGTKTLYFTIAPKTTSEISATQTTTTITLKWNKVTGASGYRVYKYNPNTKKYDALKTLAATSLKMSNLEAGTIYKYKIRSYAKDGDMIWGAYSSVFETATKPTTPKITKLTSTKGKANFTWSNVSEETGYEVYYSAKKNSGYKKVASYKANVLKGSISKLTSKNTYYFKVRAYKKTSKGTIYSSWSAVKNIKIK